MASNEYVKYGRREFPDKVRYEDALKPYEDYEVLAGFNKCDDGTDEWFLVREEGKEQCTLITIDFHLFEDNEIKEKQFDSMLSACNYIRDELDRSFSLGDAETADAIVGLLDAIFGDKEGE